MLTLREILNKKWNEDELDKIFFMIFEDMDLEEALEYENERNEEEITLEQIDREETYRNMEELLLQNMHENEILENSLVKIL